MNIKESCSYIIVLSCKIIPESRARSVIFWQFTFRQITVEVIWQCFLKQQFHTHFFPLVPTSAAPVFAYLVRQIISNYLTTWWHEQLFQQNQWCFTCRVLCFVLQNKKSSPTTKKKKYTRRSRLFCYPTLKVTKIFYLKNTWVEQTNF